MYSVRIRKVIDLVTEREKGLCHFVDYSRIQYWRLQLNNDGSILQHLHTQADERKDQFHQSQLMTARRRWLIICNKLTYDNGSRLDNVFSFFKPVSCILKKNGEL